MDVHLADQVDVLECVHGVFFLSDFEYLTGSYVLFIREEV